MYEPGHRTASGRGQNPRPQSSHQSPGNSVCGGVTGTVDVDFREFVVSRGVAAALGLLLTGNLADAET